MASNGRHRNNSRTSGLATGTKPSDRKTVPSVLPSRRTTVDEDATFLLASIVKSSDDAIITKTSSGIITSWNKGAERIYGFAAAEVIGQAISILIPPDEFLATVSHELRSPLSAIVGWTRLLEKGKAEPGKAVEIISRSASALTGLLEDLLDMSRILSGKIRLTREPVPVLEIVTNAVDAVQLTADARSIHIDVSFAPDLGMLDCDQNRVQQIVTTNFYVTRTVVSLWCLCTPGKRLVQAS